MNPLTKSMNRSAGISEMARTEALQMKGGIGESLSSIGDIGGFSQQGNRGANYSRYGLFRGWLFSAINTIAEKAAGQAVRVGRITTEESTGERRQITNNKAFLVSKMTKRAYSRATKHPNSGIEIIDSSPILDVLEKPNDIQDRWQFVYSFVANLALTGWSYVIIDTNDEGKLEFWSLPTTWVTPMNHEGKPFGKFVVKNPRRGDIEGITYDKSQVAFAYLPNPSDPLAALSPASAQLNAIKIDDKIQTSQDVFFDNGIFPSAIVTVGSNPHPEVSAGVRPRLTAAQRRQVFGVINRTMQGVAKYGTPAIVDGYIEKITKFSLDSTEMGWDKSEDKVRSRILSAYNVHPYMLGEPVGVGGYAQVAGIERVFCGKVNTYLDMLGNVLSNKLMHISQDEKILVWWEKCEPLDPNIRNKLLIEGRKNNDITRDEYRAEMGYPPMNEGSDRSRLVGDQVAMSSLLNALGSQGLLSSETLVPLLTLFLGITEEEAIAIAGTTSGSENPQEILEEMRNVALELKKPVEIKWNKSEIDKTVSELMSCVH